MARGARRRRKRTIPPTRTLVETRARATAPILSLRALPRGRTIELSEFMDPRDRLHWIGLGRGRFCHIALDDPYVSEAHCLLQCTDLGTFVKDDDSKNLTLVNGVPVFGVARLLPGMLLTVGATTFLACGEAGDLQEPMITALDVDEFLRAASELYGSTSKAAKALEIAKTTLAEWLRDGRFQRTEKNAR